MKADEVVLPLSLRPGLERQGVERHSSRAEQAVVWAVLLAGLVCRLAVRFGLIVVGAMARFGLLVVVRLAVLGARFGVPVVVVVPVAVPPSSPRSRTAGTTRGFQIRPVGRRANTRLPHCGCPPCTRTAAS